MSTINVGETFPKVINGLEKYTEYEFQVLAFTFHGDGPKSSVEVVRTKEDGKRLDGEPHCNCLSRKMTQWSWKGMGP